MSGVQIPVPPPIFLASPPIIRKKLLKKAALLISACGIIVILVVVLLTARDIASYRPGGFKLERIAHAGGGHDGKTYTNSLDALNANRDKYTLFEIDFEWTSDRELVCIHDWDSHAQSIFGQAYDPAPTLAEFEKLVNTQKSFKNCSFKTLAEWLKRNPSKKIVTDIKNNNVEGLAYIAKNYPGFAEQFIPQIYRPEEYEAVKNLGYRDIIFTLYKFKGDQDDILRAAQTMQPYAVTVSKKKIKTKFEHFLADAGINSFPPRLVRKLTALGVPVYVHTVNAADEWNSYKQSGVTEIYTDWLNPDEQ